jgi:hypothetical protein
MFLGAKLLNLYLKSKAIKKKYFKRAIELLFWKTGDVILLCFFAIYLLLESFWVQTKLVQFATEYITTELKLPSSIGKIEIVPIRTLRIQKLLIKDLEGDTLLYVRDMHVHLSNLNFLVGLPSEIRKISIDDALFDMHIHKDQVLNLTQIAQKLSSKDTNEIVVEKPRPDWLNRILRCQDLDITRTKFRMKLTDSVQDFGMNYLDLDLKDINIALRNIELSVEKGIRCQINRISTQEKCGFVLQNFQAPEFTMTDKFFDLPAVNIQSKNTRYQGSVRFDYPGGFSDFLDFVDKVKMSYVVESAYADGAEIAHFAPVLKGLNYKANLKGKVSGVINHFKAKDLHVKLAHGGFFHGGFLLENIVGEGKVPHYAFALDTFSMPVKDFHDLPIYPNWDNQISQYILPLSADSLHVHGTAKAVSRNNRWIFDLSFEGQEVGDWEISAGYYYADKYPFVAKLKGNTEDLSALLGIDILKKSSFSTQTEIKYSTPNDKTWLLEGASFVQQAVYQNENIEKLSIDWQVNSEGVKFKTASDAESAIKLNTAGFVGFQDSYPYRIKGSVQNIPMTWLGYDAQMRLSTKIDADAVFSKMLEGTWKLSQLEVLSQNKTYKFGAISLSAIAGKGYNQLLWIQSDMLDAKLEGNFALEKMPLYLDDALQSLFPKTKIGILHLSERFSAQVFVKDMRALSVIFPDFYLSKGSWVKASYDVGAFDFQAKTDSLQSYGYAGQNLEINIKKTVSEGVHLDIQAKNVYTPYFVHLGNFSLNMHAQDGTSFRNQINWYNDITNYGKINFTTQWIAKNTFALQMKPSQWVLNSKTWQIDESAKINISPEQVSLQNLGAWSGAQRIYITGKISDQDNQTVQAQITQLDLSQFSELFTKQWGQALEGYLNADLQLDYKHLFKKDGSLQGQMQWQQAKINQYDLGNLQLSTYWNAKSQSLDINGQMQQMYFKNILLSGRFYPFRTEPLDFSVDFKRTDLAALASFLPKEVKKFKAFLDGKLQLKGSLDKPLFSGKLELSKGVILLGTLGVPYQFSSELVIDKNKARLEKLRLQDPEGKEAQAKGTLNYENEDFQIALRIKAENFLWLNNTRKETPLLHGKIYAQGDMLVAYQNKKLKADGDLRLGENSQVSLFLDQGYQEQKGNFSFVSKKRAQEQRDAKKEQARAEQSFQYDVNLALTLPQNWVELDLDSKNTQQIKATVEGTLSINLSGSEDFKLFGELRIIKGKYLFDFQGLLAKEFSLKPEGSIRWSGKPEQGVLDLQADYLVRTSMKPLLGQQTLLDNESVGNANYDFLCSVILKEQLLNPVVKTQISFANPGQVDDALQTEFRKAMSVESELNKQFFALLLMQRFMSRGNSAAFGSTLDGGISTGLDLLTGQLSSFVSNLLSDNIDLKVKYNLDNNTGNQEASVGVETQLFNDRVVLKGATGIRSTGRDLNSNSKDPLTRWIGDFSVEYKVTQDGKFRLKAFNASTDQWVTDKTQNTGNANPANRFVQGVGIYYQEDFDKLKDLKIFSRKKKAKKIELKPLDTIKVLMDNPSK